MMQKNKRPIPKEFCIQKPVVAAASPPPPTILKEEPKVIFTAEKNCKANQKIESNPNNAPTSNSKNIFGPAVAAMLLMDILK